MKTTSAVTGILILLFAINNVFAQRQDEVRPIAITPYPIEITVNKTTNLIFPYTIKGVDKGSRDILAQKARGAQNILQIKAANENLQESNLTVITADGKLHSFIVNFKEKPAALNLRFNDSRQQDTQETMSPPDADSEAEIEAAASGIAEKPETVKHVRDKAHGMSLELSGIYIHHDVMYYQIKLSNSTNISYDISQLRFFIRDKKRSRRTASQELELLPLYVHGNTGKIDAGTESTLVYALGKHTIPDKKYLAVQMMEGNGGRHLKFRLGNRRLVRSTRVLEE